MAPAVLHGPSVLPRQFPAGADASNPGREQGQKQRAKAGIPAFAFVFVFEFEFEFEFELDPSSPGYPAGQEGAGND
ncbi:hypothetical protein [Stenotrophomonas sp. NA06056]|uniref:hypothetical protein n=1 Tax=Stenotrophomonas sp. NA06056 TaxID=2742129 RepID=UPI001588817B|nr:hypothetical protein [Stenotrophomonas sp. NA06056]QKW58210.1 hypothetical protein HUT07_16965 [Stenotrophomonas sp. NA06056]